jgi:hypothetical protein
MMMHHPNDLDLLDLSEGVAFERSPEVAAHVQGCDSCATALAEMSNASERSLSVAVLAPTAIQLPIRSQEEQRPAPAAGQIWKAAWDGASAILLVVSTQDALLTVLPVIDAQEADDSSVLLPPESTGWATAVRAALQAVVPLCTLDYCIAVVEQSLLTRVIAAADGADGDGDPIVNEMDERWDGAAHLQLQLRRLEKARWVPDELIDPHEEIRSRWPGPRALSEAVGVTPGRALEILNGDGALTESERAKVAELTGLDIGSGTPPSDLQWALDQPEVRPLWRKFAAVNLTEDSPQFRWQTYTNGSFALAARSTGSLSARQQALAKVKQVLNAGA